MSAGPAQEDVLGLDVSMEHPLGMAVAHSQAQGAHCLGSHHSPNNNDHFQECNFNSVTKVKVFLSWPQLGDKKGTPLLCWICGGPGHVVYLGNYSLLLLHPFFQLVSLKKNLQKNELQMHPAAKHFLIWENRHAASFWLTWAKCIFLYEKDECSWNAQQLQTECFIVTFTQAIKLTKHSVNTFFFFFQEVIDFKLGEKKMENELVIMTRTKHASSNKSLVCW